MANTLANFSGKTNRTVPPKFIEARRATAEKERLKLVRLTKKLTAHLNSLHQPVILALADHGLLVHQVEKTVREIQFIAENAELGPAPKSFTRGRPRKHVSDILARLLAHNFATLTGDKPTIPTHWDRHTASGAYLELVTQVFRALKVSGSPEAAARNVLRKPKEKRPRKFRSKLL